MWQAVGHLLPIAVAVAVSSVPIMVMIMILLSPKRKLAALAFMCGWVIGIALVIFLCALEPTRALPPATRRTQDTLAGVLQIIIGAALICASVMTLLRRSRSQTASLPNWVHSVGWFGPLPSFAVAVALNFRPKGLVLGAAAGLVLRDASLRSSEIAVAIAIYTGLAASTIVVPVIATVIAPNRVEPQLVTAQAWFSKNGAVLAALMYLHDRRGDIGKRNRRTLINQKARSSLREPARQPERAVHRWRMVGVRRCGRSRSSVGADPGVAREVTRLATGLAGVNSAAREAR